MAEKQVGEKRPREGDPVGEESSVSKRIIPTAAMDSAERARCRDVARDPAGTHYDLLNVPLTCTPDDLKFNYRRLARLLHQNRGGADQHGEDASEILARVNVAYRLLICPNARAEYDKTLTTTGSLLANFPDDQSASLFVERYCTTNVPGQQNHVESFPSVHVHKMHERPILSYNTSSNTFLDFIMEQSLCYCYLPCEPLEPAVTKILLSGEPAALAKCKELLAAAIKKWNMQDTGRPYDKDGLYLDYFASKEFMELCAKDKRDNAKERICASLQQSGHLELLEDIRLVYTDRTRGICFDLVPSLKDDPRFHRTGAEITIELQSLFRWKGRLMFGHDAPKSYSNWDFLNWCEIVVFPNDLTKINRIHTPEPPAKEDMEAKLRQFMSESPPTQVGEYCIDFQLGKCVRGEACIFSHQVPATAPGTLCYNFQKRLGCRDGENCKFLHLKGNESPLQAIVYAESTLPLLHLIAQSRAFVSPLKHTVKRLFDNQRFQETLNSARPLDKADFLATFFINARAELNELSFRLDPIVDFLIRFEFAASKDQTLRQLRAILLSLASSIIAGKNAEVPWSNVASDFPNSSWASIRKVIFPPNVAWTDSEWLQSTSFVRAIFSMTFRSFQTGLTCSKDGLSTSLIDPTASAQRTAAVDITMRRASAQMLQQQCQQQAPQRPLPPQQPQQQRQQLATWGVFLGEFAKTADKKKDVVDLVTEALYKYQAPSVPLVQIAILPMKLNLDDVACNRSWFEARGQYFDMKSQTRDELREAFPMAKSVSGCAAAGSAAEWHVSLNPHIRRAMEVTEKEDKLRTQRKQAVEEWEPVVKRGEMVSSVKSAVDACIMLYFHSKSEKQNSALPSVESLVSKICAARMENGKVKQGLPNLTPFTALDVLGYITAIQARLAKTKGEIDWTPHLNFLITLVKQAGDMMKPNAQDHAKYSIMFCGRLLDALAEAPFSTMVNDVLYKATLLEVTGCVINRMAMEVSYKSMRTGGLRRFAKVAKWVSSLPSTLSFKLAGTQWKEKWMALFTSMAKETRIMLNQTDFLRVNWQVDSPELWDLETLIKLAEAFERASDHCDVTDEIPGVKEGCEHLCRQIGGVLPDCVKDKSGSAKRTQELFIQAAKAFMGKKIVSSKGRAELYGAVCAGAKNLQASSQTKWSTDGITSLFMVFVDTQTGSCARDFAELLERDQAFLELIKEKSETDVNSILACLLLDFTREETGKECITPRKKLFSQCAGNPEVLSKIMTTKTFANYISRAPLDMTLELIDMYRTRGEISFLRPQLLPHRLVALLAVRYAKELNRTDETWPHITKILKVFHGSLPECPKLSLLVVTTGLRDMAKVSKVVADDIFPFVNRIRAQIASNKLVHSDRWPQDTALLTLQHEFVKIASCSPTGISSISSVLKELSDRCPSELNAFGPQPVEALAMLSAEFRVMRGEVKLMPFSSMMMDWVKFSDSLWSKANPAKKTGPAQPAPSPVWRTVRRVEVTSESKRNDSHMLALRGYYRAKNPTDKHNGAFVFEHEDDLGKPATERRALYYDTAEGFRGWWFGEGVGTDKVWAFRPGEAASDGLPPNNKWKVPWDGEADPTFEVVSRFHAALMV